MIDRDELQNVILGRTESSADIVTTLADWIDTQIAKAVADEREACAKVCKDVVVKAIAEGWETESYAVSAYTCEAKIRARGEK